jgi:hypothetical protein
MNVDKDVENSISGEEKGLKKKKEESKEVAMDILCSRINLAALEVESERASLEFRYIPLSQTLLKSQRKRTS